MREVEFVAERIRKKNKKKLGGDSEKTKETVDLWECKRVVLGDAAWEGRKIVQQEPSEEMLDLWKEIDEDAKGN